MADALTKKTEIKQRTKHAGGGSRRRRGMPDDPETFKLLYKHTQTHIFGLKDYVWMGNVCLAKCLSAPITS